MTAFLGRLLKFLLRPILHLDHRTVRLSSGVLEIEDVQIHPASANAALAVFGLRLVDGRLERMRVAMPFSLTSASRPDLKRSATAGSKVYRDHVHLNKKWLPG